MDKLPSCFGLHWEAGAPECAGGLDPSFLAADGSNKRSRCPYFSACASKTAAQRLQQQHQVTHPQIPMGMRPPMTPSQALIQVKPAAPVQQVQQVTVPAQQFQPMLVHPQQATIPSMVPMNFAPPYMQMTGYLTVPEPIVPGQHWSKRLGFSIARSMLKAAGHTVANFFDHNPLNPWYPQGGQG